jgi:glycosyltransferase involved in cell wall biosynthesis
MSLLPAFVAAKKSGRPLVATIHDIYGREWEDMYSGLLSHAGRYVERFLCKIPYDKLIVLNSAIKRRLIAMGIPESRLEVIYSGIDTKKIDRIKARKKKNRIVYVGRLAPQKNLDVLISAFSMVNGEAEFKVVGGGSEIDKIKRMSESMNLEIEFTGSVDNDRAIKEMKEASILVLTSSRENFGIVPLEAMRCKTAVISTRTEGPADYIENGKNGFLTDIGNAKQIAENIDLLLSDRRLYSKIVKNGYNTAGDFDWDKIIKCIAGLYFDIYSGNVTL